MSGRPVSMRTDTAGTDLSIETPFLPLCFPEMHAFRLHISKSVNIHEMKDVVEQALDGKNTMNNSKNICR
eukprot:2957778-Prymnesium_polylepis.2